MRTDTMIAWQKLALVATALEAFQTLYGTSMHNWAATLARNCFLTGALLGLPASYIHGLGLDYGLPSNPSLTSWDPGFPFSTTPEHLLPTVTVSVDLGGDRISASRGNSFTTPTPIDCETSKTPVPSSSSSSSQKHRCGTCGDSFASVGRRNKHQRDLHNPPKYHCSYCGKPNRYKWNNEDHEANHCKTRKRRAMGL
jgi:hypothetical protein